MNKINLFALIATLYAIEKNERAACVKEAAKENAVDANELFKALKEAGYDPKAEKGTAAPTGAENGAQTPPSVNTQNAGTDATTANVAQQGADKPPTLETQDGENGAKKIAVTLRHKTQYPHYRRAGLILKQTPGTFSVTEAQLAVLKLDKWVELVEGGKTK